MDTETLIRAWIEPAVSVWYRQQCACLQKAFRLYYKPAMENDEGKMNHGALAIAEEPFNEDWQLADPRRISPAMSTQQVTEWCRDIAWKLPILGDA